MHPIERVCSLFLIGSLVLAGCGEAGGTGAVATVEAGEDGKADSTSEVKVQVPGMTVWVRPVLRYDEPSERFVLAGRASKDLAAVRPFVPDDAFGSARMVSARKFEIAFDDHELNSLLSGVRLFVPLVPKGKTEPTHTAMVELSARFAADTGSSLIYLHRNIKPVRVGDDVVYRGRATIDPRLSDVGAHNDDDSEPEVAFEGDNHYRFDWFFSSLTWAAAPTEDAIHFRAEHADGRVVSRSAQIHFRAVKIGLTDGPAHEAWPERRCESRVRSCLAELPASQLDTEACGTYRQVTVCGWTAPPPVVEKPSLTVVVKDLKREVVRYSVQHQDDIAAAGGRNGFEAQTAVTEAGVSEVTDPAEDPEGHDLSQFWVFSHPDTIFPGSDIVWYAAYHRSTGALERVYRFN